MIRTFYLVLFLLIGNISLVSAQQSDNIKQADRYIDVVKVYELVVEEGYESAQIFEKLAHSYFAKRNYTEAKNGLKNYLKSRKTQSHFLTFNIQRPFNSYLNILKRVNTSCFMNTALENKID